MGVGLGLGHHECDPAKDGHRAERDDKRMHTQQHDPQAIQQTGNRPDTKAQQNRRRHHPSRGRARSGALRAEPVQEHRSAHRCQAVNGADRQINATGDNDQRSPPRP